MHNIILGVKQSLLQLIYSKSSSFQSSSEVKALFSDVSAVAAKHCKEISKVWHYLSMRLIFNHFWLYLCKFHVCVNLMELLFFAGSDVSGRPSKSTVYLLPTEGQISGAVLMVLRRTESSEGFIHLLLKLIMLHWLQTEKQKDTFLQMKQEMQHMSK